MKHIKLFEEYFVKNYGEKISQREFKNLDKKNHVLYYGQRYEVVNSDGVVLRLRHWDSGEIINVNFAMFNQKGAIVESEMVEEGVNDPGILKAFFMAGGPGSGKSFVATELFDFPKGAVSSVSYATGLKLVNNDNAFEKMLKDAGFDAGKLSQYAKDPKVWDEVMAVRDKAKGVTKRLQNNYLTGRLGQVIDGTGKDYDKIKGQRQLYRDLGYDTYMVFVNTSLEVALERNRARSRKLADDQVEKMWQAVQQNLGKFQKLFGTDRMLIVDNSSYDNQDLLNSIEKQINKQLKTPVQNPLGKRWLNDNSPANRDRNKPA